MKGDGHYNAHCEPQNSDIVQSQELLLELAAGCPRPVFGQPFGLADFGCGQGRTSCQVFEAVIELLRQFHSDTTINVFRNDLATNDFNSLARHVVARCVSGVFEFMAPGSFHQQVLPDDSLHLGTCYAALHWLRELPDTRVVEHLTHEVNHDTYGPVYSAAWQRGWRSFLRSRSVELADGGQLLVSFVARSVDDFRVHAPFELLQLAAQSMVDDGYLAAAHLEQFQIPIHRPTRDEVLAPFGPSGMDEFSDLRVVEIDVAQPECPLAAGLWQRQKLDEYACRYSGFIRAFSEPSIRAGLFSDECAERSQSLLDCLYERVRRLILAAPERFVLSRTQITLALQKPARGRRNSGAGVRHRRI